MYVREDFKTQGKINMAKIDVTGIEGFEDLSAEEKVAKLLELDIPDVAGIEEERNKFKASFDKTSKELSELKKANKKAEDERNSELSESEKRLKELEGKYSQLIREKNVADAKAEFISLGFDDENASATAEKLVDGDTAELFKGIATFVGKLRNDLKKELLKSTPNPKEQGNPKSKGMSKETFRAMSLIDKQKFAKESPDEYNRLVSGE